MSIIFSGPIQEDKLRMAYNNDVIQFYSDNPEPAVMCTVTSAVLPNFNATLYPAPNGTFYFNFKPYVSALINTHNFEDTLQPVLDRTNANSFVYNSSDNTLLQLPITLTLLFAQAAFESVTHNLTWLAGVQQLGSYDLFNTSETYMLSPFKKHSANSYYLKYWQGYPFDIAVYNPNVSLSIKNETNLLSAQFDVPGKVFRLVLSDGNDDETLEDLLPLTNGYNNLQLGNETAAGQDKFILLEKIPYKQGVYLKWLNSMGGYSYWLFEDTYSIDRSTKSLGEIDRDYNNPEDSFSRSTQIGKESQDTLKIVAELLTDEERAIVESIIDSPKIYLFTGKPYARAEYRDWLEVSLKTTQARLKNPRQPLTNFTFDIELPARFTQTL